MQQSRQEIEKNNLEALLPKLRLRKEQAVAQTYEAVELKEGYLLEVENLENELAEKRDTLSEVLSSIRTRKEQIAKLDDTLTDMLSEAQNDALRRLNQLEVLDIQIKDRKAERSSLEKEIDSLESIIPVIQEQVDNNKELAQERIDQFAEEIETKRSELEEVSEVVESAIVKMDELTTERINLEEEINEAKERIATREEELHKIASDYEEKETNLARQAKDILIIKRRLKREYESVFPKRKLTI